MIRIPRKYGEAVIEQGGAALFAAVSLARRVAVHVVTLLAPRAGHHPLALSLKHQIQLLPSEQLALQAEFSESLPNPGLREFRLDPQDVIPLLRGEELNFKIMGKLNFSNFTNCLLG